MWGTVQKRTRISKSFAPLFSYNTCNGRYVNTFMKGFYGSQISKTGSNRTGDLEGQD